MTTATDQLTAKADCGHSYPLPGPNGGASGYATVPDTGATMCYPCATTADLEQIRAGATIIGAYLSSDGQRIVNWPGFDLMQVTSETSAPNGWQGSRITFLRATDQQGGRWFGRNGGRGMHVTMRKVKAGR